MKYFVLAVIITYWDLWDNFSKFDRILSDFAITSVRLKDFEEEPDLMSRIIVWSLSKKNDEYQYVYYSKRIIYTVAVLLIPWFILVYLGEWYNTYHFLVGQLIFAIVIARMPHSILVSIKSSYDRRLKKFDKRK